MIKAVKAIISGLSEKERKLLYGACVVLAVVLFDRLIVGPFTERSAMLRDEITSQHQMTERNIRILEFRNRIIADALEYRPYYVPTRQTREERIGTFLREVESLAKEAGITVSNIDPVRVPEGAEEMPVYRLSLDSSGPMERMVDFFHGVATAELAIRIASFDINVTNVDQYIVDCSMVMEKLIVTDQGIPLEDPPPEVLEGTEASPGEDGFFITDKVILE